MKPIADIYDENPNQVKVASPLFKSYGKNTQFHGEIVTVKCYEDNSKVKQMCQSSGEGKVLVVDGGGSLSCALVGGNVAVSAAENGWSGLIVYGCIRDSVEIADVSIGIKALNTNPTKSIKNDVGLINVKVNFAGIDFVPGAYVYSDEDGIAVSEDGLL